ncbi:MAG: cell division protein FtsZ [Patescibacteria group bacterium]|nr:cell division protein FtsZ [Patescibacteria group bacterium]
MSSEVKLDIETAARILVVGVGGAGGNAIDRMIEANLKGVEFVAVNTDVQDLHHNKASEKIHIGKNLTKGLGAGMNPEIGRQAAEENRDEIQETLKDADMIFVTCGMGGGTGTGASPIVAEVAKESGALTVGIITKPFTFEGSQRAALAEEGIEHLRDRVDTLVTIPNDRLLQVIDKKTTLLSAFRVVDDILRQGVQGISDIITLPGIVSVDFADIKAIMQDAGSALMGIGKASGENRATEAAKQAINSPLLEMSIDGARGVLFNVSGGSDIGMLEINEAANVITENVDPNAKVIFGAVAQKEEGKKKKKGEIKITVIATGFEEEEDKMGDMPIAQESTSITQESTPATPEETPVDFHQQGSITVSGSEGDIKEVAPEVEDDKGKIPQEKPKKPIDYQAKNEVDETKKDEDKLDIPTFIRNKMNKNKIK